MSSKSRHEDSEVKRSQATPATSGSNHVSKPQTPCFTAGTTIATRCGDVLVEELRIGDRVMTRDNGYRRILWIGARHFDRAVLTEYPELNPVRITAGALGPQGPARDILVSPQHRMLLAGAWASDLTGETEILASAETLVGLGLAEETRGDAVTYYHILFEDHEIVLANGAWSESFNPELAALEGLHQLQRSEILAIFPELADRTSDHVYPLARTAFDPDRRRAA